MAWKDFERRKSCERNYRRADEKKERKRKAMYHDARLYKRR